MIPQVKKSYVDVEVLGWRGYTWSAIMWLVGRPSKFSETTLEAAYIVCEYNRTDIAGETLRKIQSGSASYFETVVFLCTPIGH